MTWKAMSADRACDLVDFWLAAPWPLTAPEVQQLGTQVGWNPEEDDDEMMINDADALSEPAVAIITTPSGETASFTFWVTDIVRGEVDDEGTEFLNDAYAQLVREGERRWLTPSQSRGEQVSAQWEIASGARVQASRGPRSMTIDFITPQYAEVLDDLGE